MKIIAVVWSLVMLALGALAAPVDLVRNGKPVADIVISTTPNAAVKRAALDLQEHLEKMSGAKLDIVTAPREQLQSHVYVGTNELTAKLGFKPAEFKTSGFEIVAKDNYIILSGHDRLSQEVPYGMEVPESQYLGNKGPKPKDYPSAKLKAWQDFCGEKFTTAQLDFGGKGRFNAEAGLYKNDDVGTWYAASELLEQLGVRFYAPYENGTVIPEMKNISVTEQALQRAAAFGRREWHYSVDQIPENILWFKRLKAGNYAPIIYNHTTVAIYASIEQHKLHQEYLACDANGKPYLRDYGGQPPEAGGVPRYTNPDFRRASAVLMNRLFEASPELYAVSIGSPDGAAQVDARDIDLYGTQDDSREQKASNYFWDYHVFLGKELKKTHPDKFLIYVAAGGAREIPTNIKPDDPDNIIFGLSQTYSANRVMEEADGEVLAHRRKLFAAYKPRGKSPVWDYYLYYRYPSYPRFPVFFTAHLQYEMQEMQPYSDGKFIEINLGSQSEGTAGKHGARIGAPALTHLMYYWQSKLFWDPAMDRQATLAEYYHLYFGPAKKEMREFHEFAEEVWTRQESRSVTATTGFLKEKDVERYFDLLSRARKKAGRDTVYGQRIAALESEMESLKKLFPNMKRSGPEFRVHTAESPLQVDGDLDKHFWTSLRVWFTMRDLVTGEIPDKNQTLVSFRWPFSKSELDIAVICRESRVDKIVAKAKNNDDPALLNDDAVEIYLETPERSYFKIVVNAEGKIWDASQDATIVARDTLPVLWNPGIKAAARKEKDRWLVEMSIPTKDFGLLGPDKPYMWGINVCRRRLADGEPEGSALVPTGTTNSFELTKLGCLWVRY